MIPLGENPAATEAQLIQFPTFVSIETCAFSGATLLSFLLGLHPRIATVGEMNGLISSVDPNSYLCSCRQRILDCEFWKAVGAVMQKRGLEFDVTDFNMKCDLGGPWLIRRLRMASFRNRTVDSIRDAIIQAFPKEKQSLKKLVERNAGFIEAVLEVTGRDIFVDSSKDRRRVSYLRTFSALDIRSIHLVRDVRAFVTSHLRRKEGLSAPNVAKLWVKENKKIERFLATLPQGRWIRILYDDLCLDSQGTLNRLYHFCGVKPLVIKDFRSGHHHIVGNPMRLSNSSEIKLDERWKAFLTSQQLREINAVAGALNRRYGHEQS